MCCAAASTPGHKVTVNVHGIFSLINLLLVCSMYNMLRTHPSNAPDRRIQI